MPIRLNDRPLDDLVWQVCTLDGHLAPTVPQVAPLALGNSPGVFGTELRVSGRTITIGCDVRPASLPDRQVLMDGLRRRLGGLLEVRTDDLPSRVLMAVLQDVQVEFYTGAHAQAPVYVTLTLLAVDPARRDIEPLLYGLSTARVACPLGTDTSAPDVWIFGACTNPAIVLRAHTGAEVARMTFAVVLAADDALVVEAAAQRITRYVAGVVQTGAANGLAAFASGAFPVLDPADGAADGSSWPTVQLEASAGTPTGLVRYARRW